MENTTEEEKKKVIQKIYNIVKAFEDLSNEPIALTLLLNKGEVFFLEAGLTKLNNHLEEDEEESTNNIYESQIKPIPFDEVSNYIR
jgi:hypothetical protein